MAKSSVFYGRPRRAIYLEWRASGEGNSTAIPKGWLCSSCNVCRICDKKVFHSLLDTIRCYQSILRGRMEWKRPSHGEGSRVKVYEIPATPASDFFFFCTIITNTQRMWSNPHSRLLCEQPQSRLFTSFRNGRRTTLILNHALWLGLFAFLIILFHPSIPSSHPPFRSVMEKKVAESEASESPLSKFMSQSKHT